MKIAWAVVTADDGFERIYPGGDDELIAADLLKMCQESWVKNIQIWLKNEK